MLGSYPLITVSDWGSFSGGGVSALSHDSTGSCNAFWLVVVVPSPEDIGSELYRQKIQYKTFKIIYRKCQMEICPFKHFILLVCLKYYTLDFTKWPVYTMKAYKQVFK